MLKFMEFKSCGVTGVYADALFRPRSHNAGDIRKQLYFHCLACRPHYSIEKKTDIYGNALENRRIWKRCLFVFKWTENSLKKELFESDVVTIIVWFSCSIFPQTIQTKRSSLRFSSGLVWTDTFNPFSEPWNLLLYQEKTADKKSYIRNWQYTMLLGLEVF